MHAKIAGHQRICDIIDLLENDPTTKQLEVFRYVVFGLIFSHASET